MVFKLAPNPDGSWTQSVLYSFTGGEDGNTPVAGMISDESGNLYGTAMFGGRFYSCIDGLGCGTVFELAPEPDGRWMQSVIFAFQGSGGGEPTAPLIFDMGPLQKKSIQWGTPRGVRPNRHGIGEERFPPC